MGEVFCIRWFPLDCKSPVLSRTQAQGEKELDAKAKPPEMGGLPVWDFYCGVCAFAVPCAEVP